MPTIAPLDLTGHCIDARFIQEVPFFALADGNIHRLDNGHKVVEAHDGLLCAIPSNNGKFLLTGGEDGKVCSTGLNGVPEELSHLPRKWMTALAAAPGGAIAFASGRSAWVRSADGSVKELSHERSVEGLAFAQKGLRLAVARYNGVTLHWPATNSAPTELEWKGAHVMVMFSPDNRFLVTSMQENALHGWRLDDNRHMRMTGYPNKVKSWSWSPKGKWLATAGAPAAIVWPFSGKDGPMGKGPLELGTRSDNAVTAVSCHPLEEIVAIGYSDGMILVGRFGDQKEVLLRRGGNGAISSMNWDQSGHRLAFGSEVGDCGVIDITG